MLNEKGKLALVVDDSMMQCKMLAVLLQEEGYSVVTANNGEQGVDMYVQHQPDLVLMDINMPVMDGYTAAREIKKISKGSLAPLIFITSLDTDQAYIEAIEAGGDGILVRPFSPEVFKAKIKSIARISDLYGQVKSLQQAQQQDAELAEKLMSDVIESRNYSLERIHIIKQAATLFSGDIQLSALSPNGNINILLGDFTGHGLRSSIGAIPIAETFRAMTKKGFSLYEIITQINIQLYHLLPQDLFLAAAFVTISPHDQSVYVFNAGLPDVYLINDKGNIKDKLASVHPPLGVIEKLIAEVPLVVKQVSSDDYIVLISDGIIEARDSDGKMFEQLRFEQSIIKGAKQHNIAKTLIADVNAFCQDMPQEDDLSVIEVPCGGWESQLQAKAVPTQTSDKIDTISFSSKPNWFCSFSLTGAKLAQVNPVPIVMNQIQELEGAGEHWQSVYTILTELYVNALDHGILQLDSNLKDSAEGFADYFQKRQSRLMNLTRGEIDIYVEVYHQNSTGKIVIKVKDSGQGFNTQNILNMPIPDINDIDVKLSGRGILLVKQLCASLNYYDNGCVAEAIYLWDS